MNYLYKSGAFKKIILTSLLYPYLVFANFQSNYPIVSDNTVQIFTITPKTSSHGIISPASLQSVPRGKSLTFTALPNAGYDVYQWLVDGEVKQNGGTYFTLSNITQSHSVKVKFYDYANHLVLMSGGGGPGNNQPPLFATSIDNGESWQFKQLDPNLFSGVMSKIICNHHHCIAGGVMHNTDTDTDQLNFIYSSDKGLSWRSAWFNTDDTKINEMSCAGETDQSICLAVTVKRYFEKDIYYSFFSRDNGATWSHTAEDGTSVSCSSEKNQTICASVGQHRLATTTDRAISWQRTYLPLTGFTMSAVSCTGGADSAFCAAVAKDSASNTNAILITQDCGKTWEFPNNFLQQGKLNSISCIGKRPNVTCTIVGSLNNSPLIISSDLGGESWQIKKVKHLPQSDDAEFSTVKCYREEEDKAYCIAGGFDKKASVLLAISQDGGTTWKSSSTDPLPAGYGINDIHCSHGPVGICLAGGGYIFNDTQPYLLLISKDDGLTWQKREIPNSPPCPTRPGTICSSIHGVGIAE